MFTLGFFLRPPIRCLLKYSCYIFLFFEPVFRCRYYRNFSFLLIFCLKKNIKKLQFCLPIPFEVCGGGGGVLNGGGLNIFLFPPGEI